MTSQAMLMFSLGSVQAFISQARKTRDLWLGSYLYSALMEAAMWEMAVIDPEKNIHEGIVFPSETRLLRRLHEDDYVDDESYKKNIPELPNKYVAIFENADRARDVAKQSADRVKECWEKICKAVWEDIILASGISNLDNVKRTWQRQTEDMGAIFEIFWVVVEGNPEEYSQWLEETEKALNARKLIRSFVAQSEAGEKSTISGEHEALSRSEKGSPAHTRQEVRRFWQELSSKLVEEKGNKKKIASPLDISTDGTERLDAIDTIKRFAMLTDKPRTTDGQRIIPKQPFPTVSSIATAAFVKKLIDQLNGEDTDRRLVKALEAWEYATREPLRGVSEKAIPALYMLAREKKPVGKVEPVEILKRDGDCFMPETFRFQRLQKDYDIKEVDQAKDRADKGQKALKDLLEITDELNIPRPRPYYAILQMDGDGMGKIMGSVDNRKEHREISQSMANFASDLVPLIVERDYLGRLVYAGGDDVLAFSTLRDLLKLGDNLQSTYCTNMLNVLKQHQKTKNKVSASMGIAIAHTYSPLSFVLRSSQAAEKSAKNQYGRNALVVTILRRSGQQTRVGCKWRYANMKNNDAQPINLFQHFSELFRDDVLSPKCIHLLLEESPSLIKMPPEAQVSEIKRIFKRQSSSDSQHKQRVAHLDQDAQHLVDLAQAMEDQTCRDLYFNDHPEVEDNEQHIPAAELEPYYTRLALDLHSDEHRRGLVEALGWLLVMEFLDRKRELS